MMHMLGIIEEVQVKENIIVEVEADHSGRLNALSFITSRSFNSRSLREREIK